MESFAIVLGVFSFASREEMRSAESETSEAVQLKSEEKSGGWEVEKSRRVG